MTQRLTLTSPDKPGTQPVAVTERLACGGPDFWMIAGPCAVEGLAQLETVTRTLLSHGVITLRGGAFKPRTSPYSFQGLGIEGLKMLDTMRKAHGMVVVTEVMAIEQIEDVARHADVLQVGSRNMQNFDLLRALGRVDRPVLLKRGLSATLDEFLWAAEYVMAGGNNRVILCERGIRSFDPETRNVLDLGAVAVLKRSTHLPVIVDPSHAAGRRDIIADLARAAVAVGADGLIVEVHPRPDQSVSDAQQALSCEDFSALMAAIAPVASAVGRSMPVATKSPRVLAS